MVSYKTGAAFRPKDIRDALKKTDVGVTEFQISARGQVQQQSGSVYSLPAKMCFFLSRQPVRHEATIFLSSAFVDTPWKIVFRFIERLLQSRKSFFHGVSKKSTSSRREDPFGAWIRGRSLRDSNRNARCSR